MARVKAAKLQLDKKINFAQVGQRPSRVPAYIAGGVGAAAFVCVFLKIGVFDRLAQVSREQAKTASMREELVELTTRAKELSSVPEQYYHYTLSDMTEEELSRVQRSDVSDLVLDISKKVVALDSFRVTGNDLTISVTARALGDITRLVGELEANPLVESVSLSTAQSYEDNGVGKSLGGDEVFDVKAMLNIFIKQPEEP